MQNFQTCSQVPFEFVCKFFDRFGSAEAKRKGAQLRAFREKCVPRTSDDIFQIYRLLLPALDKERGNYGLKESKLAAGLIKACGLDPKTSSDAQSANNWKKFGTKHAGNFAAVMERYLFGKHCAWDDGTREAAQLTVGELNERLTGLANSEDTEEKVGHLRWLVVHTSKTQMRWIVQIILKDLKIALSEKCLFRDFHKDAEDLYNVTMDMERVCKELKNPNKRFPRKDVEPGSAARPQLAQRADSIEDAFKKLRGKEFVVEAKFDGERVQLHRNGDRFWYFSRRGKEHGSRRMFDVFNTVASKQIRHRKCILDGEMIIWNDIKKCFEPFGTLRSAFWAAKNMKRADDILDLESVQETNAVNPDYEIPTIGNIRLVYIAFDILFAEDQSVMNRSLQERQQLLRAALSSAPDSGFRVGGSALKGMMIPLLPDVRVLSTVPFSKTGHTLQDVQDMYNVAIERKEEGIVLKSLDSQWRLNDRSASWIKVKPDYLANHEIDAVIIAGHYGTGKHGGKIAEYLLGLRDTHRGGSAHTYVSFCRVGTGVSDAERDTVREKLAPYLVQGNCPKCYRICGKEKPDAWVTDPSKSIVLQVRADIRTIVSTVFASKYSLRFPRIDRIRWDKAPSEAMTEQELEDLVRQNEGTLAAASQKPRKAEKKSKKKNSTPSKAPRPNVVEHFLPADVSGVQVEQDLLQGAAVCFLSHGTYQKSHLEETVRKLGGTVYMNPIASVKYILAGDVSNFKVQNMMTSGKHDIISVEWLIACAEKGRSVPLGPRHYLYKAPKGSGFGYLFGEDCSAELSSEDVKQMVDRHMVGPVYEAKSSTVDSDAVEMAVEEVKRVFAQMHVSNSPDTALEQKNVFFLPKRKYLPTTSNLDATELLDGAKERLETVQKRTESFEQWQWEKKQLRVRMCGGKLSSSLNERVSHIVVDSQNYSSPIDLLNALTEGGAGTAELTMLKNRMDSQRIEIVTESWVDEQSKSTVPVPINFHKPSFMQDNDMPWPWETYGVVTPKKSPYKKNKRKRPGFANSESDTQGLEGSKRSTRIRARGGRSRDRGKRKPVTRIIKKSNTSVGMKTDVMPDVVMDDRVDVVGGVNERKNVGKQRGGSCKKRSRRVVVSSSESDVAMDDQDDVKNVDADLGSNLNGNGDNGRDSRFPVRRSVRLRKSRRGGELDTVNDSQTEEFEKDLGRKRGNYVMGEDSRVAIGTVERIGGQTEVGKVAVESGNEFACVLGGLMDSDSDMGDFLSNKPSGGVIQKVEKEKKEVIPKQATRVESKFNQGGGVGGSSSVYDKMAALMEEHGSLLDEEKSGGVAKVNLGGNVGTGNNIKGINDGEGGSRKEVAKKGGQQRVSLKDRVKAALRK